MNDLQEKILSVICSEQKRQGITTRNLAQIVGCTERAVNYWKCGERNISLRMAEQMLSSLGYELKIVKEGE